MQIVLAADHHPGAQLAGDQGKWTLLCHMFIQCFPWHRQAAELAKDFNFLALVLVHQNIPSEPSELALAHTFEWLIVTFMTVGLITVVFDTLLTSLNPERAPDPELTEQLP